MGMIGMLFSVDNNPQLFENFFIPNFGSDLVPSGNIIRDVPFLSFFDPSCITFFILLYFFDLFKWIGFKHANAHPKIGIYKSSCFIMLEDGIMSVWRKNDSHCPWWFDTKIQGVFGIFSAPDTFHEIPQSFFNRRSMLFTQNEAIYCNEIVVLNG